MERGTFAEDIDARYLSTRSRCWTPPLPIRSQTAAGRVSDSSASSAWTLLRADQLRDKPVRVTYLHYGDFFKWLNNSQGIPAYMVIDMVTQEE